MSNEDDKKTILIIDSNAEVYRRSRRDLRSAEWR